MKKLSAKEQIVLVLCDKLGIRQSMEIKSFEIKMKLGMGFGGFTDFVRRAYQEYFHKPSNTLYKVIWHDGDTYSRKWRELKGKDYFNYWLEFFPRAIYQKKYISYNKQLLINAYKMIDDGLGVSSINSIIELSKGTYRPPQLNYKTNTWCLPKQFCKFLRHERDRILRRFR